jgi:hypothetical protein
VKVLFSNFGDGRQTFWNTIPKTTPGFWTPDTTNITYSVPLWGLVKSWELNNEFQLEGLSQAFYGPMGSPRAWAGQFPFFASPNISSIPPTYLKNGKKSTHDYLAFTWYHLQLLLNDSNKQQSSTSPIDWGYLWGALNAMSDMVHPAEALHYEWLIRGLQISNNGKGPDVPFTGWQWQSSSLFPPVDPVESIWIGVPQATRIALSEGFLRSWLALVSQFTPQQFYLGTDQIAPTQIPTPGRINAAVSGRLVDVMWYTIPQYRYVGVNQTLINQLADWAKTIWPLGNWDATKTASCWISNSSPVCSTEQ